MIDFVYSAIHQNPKATAWAFGIINALWVAFVYFNKKRHERELQQFQHSFNLDLERRRAVFALKVSSYERYVRLLDDFGKKYQTQLGERMAPMFSQYLSEVLAVGENQDKKRAQDAAATFSNNIILLMNQAAEEYIKIQAESKTLKLTASAALLASLEELENCVANSMKTAQEFMGQFAKLLISNDQQEIQRHQKILSDQGRDIQRMSRALELQMRTDLDAI